MRFLLNLLWLILGGLWLAIAYVIAALLHVHAAQLDSSEGVDRAEERLLG